MRAQLLPLTDTHHILILSRKNAPKILRDFNDPVQGRLDFYDIYFFNNVYARVSPMRMTGLPERYQSTIPWITGR